MKRRQFLALSTLAACTALGTGSALADDGQIVEFSPEAYQEALESGEPFMLDFFATW